MEIKQFPGKRSSSGAAFIHLANGELSGLLQIRPYAGIGDTEVQ